MSLASRGLDWNTVTFFLKIGLVQRKSLTHAKRGRVRQAKKRLFPVSLSVFGFSPDLLFDCSRVLKYAKNTGYFTV